MFSKIRNYIYRELTWHKLSYRFKFAHHPTCDPYKSQRFDILGISFCQGCTIITLSGIISFLFFITIQRPLFEELFVIYGIMAMVVFVADGFGFGRIGKRIARLVIGITLGTACAQILLNPIKNSLLILGFIFITYFGYRFFRSFTPSKDLCQTCPELIIAPRCTGIIHQFEANKKYQELVLPILSLNKVKELQVNLGNIEPINQNLDEFNLPNSVKVIHKDHKV